MQPKHIYEFLLWDNCNNHCSFCFQRLKPRIFKDKEQQIILNKVISFLSSDNYEKGNHVLVVGGEMFDADRQYLIPFFEALSDMMVVGDIDLLYINTNLIYQIDDDSLLTKTLDIFDKKNLFERLKFTTSYDLEGRFKKEEDRLLCLNNMRWLYNKFPSLNTVANIILTKKFCDSVLGDTFDLKDFMESNHVKVNLIPYIVLTDSLCATREEIFATLLKINETMPDFIKGYVENMDLKHKRFLYACYPDEFKLCSCEDSECGHSVNFKKYNKRRHALAPQGF